jgi:hypothetical protein
MSKAKQTYLVKATLEKGKPPLPFLVLAKSRSGALNHVASKYLTVERPSGDELYELGQQGVVREEAVDRDQAADSED